MKNLYETLLKIVNEQTGENFTISDTDKSWQDTDIDSLDVIEIIMVLEEHFDVELDESEIEKYDTVSKIATRLIEDWPDEVEQYEINLPALITPDDEPSLKMYWDGNGKPTHKQKILYLPSDQIFTFLAESSSGKAYVCEEPDGKLTKVFPYECDGFAQNRAKEELNKLITDRMKLMVDNYIAYRNDETFNEYTTGLAEQLNILYNHAKADILGETK